MARLSPSILALVLASACRGQILEPADGPSGALEDGGVAAGSDGGTTITPPPRLVCDDQRHPAATDLHRLSTVQYRNAIADIFDQRVAPSSAYPSSYGQSVTGYSTEEAINQVGEQGADQLRQAAEDVAIDVAAALPQLLPCSTGANPGASCLGTFFDTFGRRAYRRSLTAEERQALQETFDAAQASGADFTDSVALSTAHLLQSPQFLYSVEDAAGSGRALSGVELASRLSFTFWGSVPDDALLALGESGALEDPATLAAQAQRLFDSPKADATLARLVREWTQTERVAAGDKDSAVYPFFNAGYAASLNESFDRYVVDQIRGGGSLQSLLTSNESFVDSRIADQFGVSPAPAPGEWQKVALDPTRYAGIASQPALLASYAHANEASFVFRGRFVEKRLLCNTFAPPPANAQATFSMIALPPDPTGKEISEGILAQGACASCHSLLNPPGLAFEHFDGAGRYQEQYSSGRTIDPSGVLLGLSGGAVSFSSHVELASKLALAPEVERCAVRQMFRFTFSRPETSDDGCALQAVNDAFAASDGTLSTTLRSIVATDAFTWRVDL